MFCSECDKEISENSQLAVCVEIQSTTRGAFLRGCDPDGRAVEVALRVTEWRLNQWFRLAVRVGFEPMIALHGLQVADVAFPRMPYLPLMPWSIARYCPLASAAQPATDVHIEL
jgi:hypothetical protein